MALFGGCGYQRYILTFNGVVDKTAASRRSPCATGTIIQKAACGVGL